MNRGKAMGWALALAVSVAAGACASSAKHADSGSVSGTGGAGGCADPDVCNAPPTDLPGDGGGGGGPTACGGLAGIPCPDGFYCAFNDDACGGDDVSGTCERTPTGCDKHLEPVCGCDGKLYQNPCEATLAGTSPSSSTGCMFDCGTIKCAHEDEYCQITKSGPMGDDFACLKVPGVCEGEPSCSCVPLCTSCAESPSGDVTVTCEGF